MSNEISFFATPEDMKKLLRAVEDTVSLEYIEAGVFEKTPTTVSTSSSELNNLGRAVAGDRNHETCYLVGHAKLKVKPRPVPLTNGGVRYAIDQLANPQTIALRPGGIFRNGCIIAGQVGTASKDPISQELFKIFSQHIRKQFAKIKSFYVGEEAAQKLDAGARLTLSIRSPREYDLSRS